MGRKYSRRNLKALVFQHFSAHGFFKWLARRNVFGEYENFIYKKLARISRCSNAIKIMRYHYVCALLGASVSINSIIFSCFNEISHARNTDTYTLIKRAAVCVLTSKQLCAKTGSISPRPIDFSIFPLVHY